MEPLEELAPEPVASPIEVSDTIRPESSRSCCLCSRSSELGGGAEVEPGEYTPLSPALLSLGRGNPEHNVEETSRRLTRALSDLGVEAQVIRAVVGPRVTRYELRLGSGVKVGKVRNLQQDIAYALAATEIRILAPIPGKSAVGVEVPNTRPAKVTLGDVFLEYPEGNDWTLPVGLQGHLGAGRVFDLADMPHRSSQGPRAAARASCSMRCSPRCC